MTLAYLCDADPSPFLFPEQLQGSLGGVMVLFGDGLEHGLWQLDMAVLVLAVGVSEDGRE